MKHLLIAMLAAMMIPFAAFGKKEKKGADDNKAPHNYRVVLSDGSTVEGILSKDWVRWPAKSVNVDFKIKAPDGTETKITVEEIDTIYDLTNGDKFIAANIPVPKIGNTGRVVKWIAKCGPKSEHGEIITYVAWFSFSNGTRSNWELAPVHCMRFDNDSVAYPFQYPNQNGSFNTSVMKKHLKEIRPEAVEYINKYFKDNKKLKKQLPDNPGLFLEAYEQYLREAGK
ncbi:MAG: hypothetical protein NC210_05485 [[Clostridium] fimetarium]|nr:hypothetical protein [Alistipes timonensis]MCM1405860.1 hypothetical protein [[Clostridium] fimetarium]